MKTFKNIVIANIVILFFIGACAAYSIFDYDIKEELQKDMTRLEERNDTIRKEKAEANAKWDQEEAENSALWGYKRCQMEFQKRKEGDDYEQSIIDGCTNPSAEGK